MKLGVFILGLLLISCFTESMGEDLKLRNGKVYSNYRVTSHNSKNLKISFVHSNGSRKTAVIAPDDLPLKLQRKYFWKNPDQGLEIFSMSSILKEFAEDLKKELLSLSGKDDRFVQAAIDSHNRDLRGIIAARGEEADFKVERIDDDGAWLKVVSVKRSSNLKSDQYIYLHGFKKNTRFFSGSVYPTGCRSNSKKFGNAMIYGVSADSALEMANRFIGTQIRSLAEASNSGNIKKYYRTIIGDNSSHVVKQQNDDDLEGAVLYSVNDENYDHLRNSSALSGGVRTEKIKNVRVVTKSCCGSISSSSCGSSSSCSGGKKPSSETQASQTVKHSSHKSIVQRNTGHSGNYGVLPEHLAPGRKSTKSSKSTVQRSSGSIGNRGVLPEHLRPGKTVNKR